jgi:hypothetical protein
MTNLIDTPVADVKVKQSKQFRSSPNDGTTASLDSPSGACRSNNATRANDQEAKGFVRRLNDFLSRKEKEDSVLRRLQEQVERQKYTSDDPAVWHAKLAAGRRLLALSTDVIVCVRV